MDAPSLMSVRQAAAYACVSESVLRGWLKAGLPHYRLGLKRGKIAVQKGDLDAWLATFKVTHDRPPPSRTAAASPVLSHLRLS